MKNTIKLLIAVVLCLGVILALSSCSVDKVIGGLTGNQNTPDGEVKPAGTEIINGEVFTYDVRGERVLQDRKFIKHENNTYYVINNFVTVGNYVVEGIGYVFDENGILTDKIINKEFVNCDGDVYYVENNVVARGERVINGGLYNFDADGKMFKGHKDGQNYGEDGRLVADKIFVTINNNTYYLVNNEVILNQYVINGNIYNFGKNGKMIIGEKDGYTYGEDGKLIADKIFITINNNTYYIVNNIIVNEQILIDGSFYFFDTDGKMFVGEKDGFVYGEDGKLVADEIFLTINNDVYYFINNAIVYNKIVINGKVYDFGSDGKMIIGQIGDYLFGEDGALIADQIFITINNNTYYIINNAIVYNQIVINGNIYNFGDDGKMVVDAEKDGYSYDSEGKLVANEIFITINNNTYYIINNAIVYNQIVINGNIYNFGNDGNMIIGGTDNDGYVYDNDGKLVADKIFITINNNTYYIINNVIIYNLIVINGDIYNFGDDGKMIVNGEKDGYFFGADGKIIADNIFITINFNTYYVAGNQIIYNFENVGPDGDSDSDGLSNRDEIKNGTNPFNYDTDGDGASDGKEVQLGFDPNSYNSSFGVVAPPVVDV